MPGVNLCGESSARVFFLLVVKELLAGVVDDDVVTAMCSGAIFPPFKKSFPFQFTM